MSSLEEENSWKIDAYECDIEPSNIYEPVWETANHELIPVSRMETSHIKNCIHFIQKHDCKFRPKFLRIFEKELRKRRWERRL